MKDDGLLIVSVPINENLEKVNIECPHCGTVFNRNGHLREYSENIIKSELENAGFVVKDIKRLFAFRRFYFFKKILTKIFINHWKPNNLIIVARKLA